MSTDLNTNAVVIATDTHPRCPECGEGFPAKDGRNWLHFEDSECWLNLDSGQKWYQKQHVLDILDMSESKALDALAALEGMDIWRLLVAIGERSGDPRTFEYDRWREVAADALRKMHEERIKLAVFIKTHDGALKFTSRPDGGYAFTCPECGNRAAALLSEQRYFYVTHTLKSGLPYDSVSYTGSCPLSQRGYGDAGIDVTGLPTNPPVRTYAEPETLEGALSLDGEEGEDDRDWMVEGLIARGDYVSLFGPSGVGKSLLMLDWSLRMARQGLRVLYLDKENPGNVIRARLRAMGAGQEDMRNLIILSFVELPDLATREGADAIGDKVSRSCADVVVLDTVSKFSQAGQAAMSDRWQAMYNLSISPLLADGVAVVQLDHTGHGNRDRERDSSAKRDNVSVAYGLMPGGRPGMLTLTRAKNRPNHPGDDAITLHRVSEPVLTHTTGDRVDPEILSALRELEKAEVPLSAGRDAARTALKDAGVPGFRTEVLAAAIRLRKASETED